MTLLYEAREALYKNLKEISELNEVMDETKSSCKDNFSFKHLIRKYHSLVENLPQNISKEELIDFYESMKEDMYSIARAEVAEKLAELLTETKEKLEETSYELRHFNY
jgi:hypothetical protein